MTRLLVFPALFSLLVVWMIVSHFSALSVLMLGVWVVRLLFLKRPLLLLTAVVMGGIAGGRTLYVKNESKTVLDADTQTFLLSLHEETVETDGDRLKFYGTVLQTGKAGPVNEEVVVFYTFSSTEEKEKWEKTPIPDTVRIEGALEIPSGQRNPYQFDYAWFLKQRHIHWALQAEEISEETDATQAAEKDIPVLFRPSKWRKAALENVENNLSGKTADYVKMMLFADKRSVEQNVMEDFRELGIIHLLSISGLHIHLLITGTEWMLLRLGLTRERIPFLFLLLLPAYGTMAGWGTSVFRAVCQSWLLYAGRCVSFRLDSLSAWSLTLFLACVVNPYQVYSIGFQLSYGLSLILILISHSDWIKRIPNGCLPVWTTFLLSLVSIPILSYHFFEFPWFSLIANLLVVPLFSWIVLPGLAGIFLLSLPFSGWEAVTILNETMNRGLDGLEWIIETVSSLPGLSIITGRLPWMGMVAVFLGILCMFYVIEQPLIHKKWILTAGIFCFAAGLFSQRYSPAGKVVMIDVGQGDSILIKHPFGKMSVLIDTGGSHTFEKEDWQIREEPYSVGKEVVVPVLKSFGVHSLDQLILTHSDLDHTGELAEINEAIDIDELVLTEGTLKDETILPLASIVKEDGAAVRTVRASKEQPLALRSGLGVLWPFEEGTGSNNDSLVLYGRLGEYTWLFTGDLEEAGERQLIQTYPSLHADILKAGHHGSRTSTSAPFLQTVSPKIALISAGKNNWYGHPHEKVLQRLKEKDIRIWRTDENGGMVYTYYPWQE